MNRSFLAISLVNQLIFCSFRRATLTDLIEKALKRGKEDEQRAASILAALVCVQLGLSETAEDFYNDMLPTLATQLGVPTAPQGSRAAMATTLGLLAFLQCPQEETEEVMGMFQSVFFAANAGAELQSEALSSWALLATFLPAYRSADFLRGNLSTYLLAALDSTDVDLRIAAGEAVAVLYEQADDDAALKEEFHDKIKSLSTDSNKHRSKRDRKEQRSSFREVVKTIEGEESPVLQTKVIRYHKDFSEKMVIDSWRAKKQYDLLCKFVSMDVYLQRSEIVRDIFGLGPPPDIEKSKGDKLSKHSKVRLRFFFPLVDIFISLVVTSMRQYFKSVQIITGASSEHNYPY